MNDDNMLIAIPMLNIAPARARRRPQPWMSAPAIANNEVMNGPSNIAPITAGALLSSKPIEAIALDNKLKTMKFRVAGPPGRARS